MRLKWKKPCVFSLASADNTNANPNNIIFTIKDEKLYIPAVTLSAKDNQKLSNLLAKDLKDQILRINMKTRRIKIQQMNIDIFSNQYCWN